MSTELLCSQIPASSTWSDFPHLDSSCLFRPHLTSIPSTSGQLVRENKSWEDGDKVSDAGNQFNPSVLGGTCNTPKILSEKSQVSPRFPGKPCSPA